MRYGFVGWGEVSGLARRLARQVAESGYRPDIIVAIGRGGWVPARIVADFLGMMDLTSFKIEHYHATRKDKVARIRYPLNADIAGRRVLLVDDVADSGDTFAVALDHLRRVGPPAEVRSAALHYKTASPYVPDYSAKKLVRWRWIVYPWAVAEDVGALLAAMRPRPADAAEAAERLRALHGIRVSHALAGDLLDLATDRSARPAGAGVGARRPAAGAGGAK
jgi:hypothetical protein